MGTRTLREEQDKEKDARVREPRYKFVEDLQSGRVTRQILCLQIGGPP
jgi:hypothetical protein